MKPDCSTPRPFSSAGAFAAVLLLALVTSVCGQNWEETIPPFAPGNFPEPRPVRVRYDFGWNGVAAATAELHFSRNAEDHYQLEGSGQTVGLARKLWKFDVRHLSTTEAHTLRPIQVNETESARSKEWETEVHFTPEAVTSVRAEKQNTGTKTKTRTFAFPNVLSLNSALLYLRAKPLPDGAVERVVVFPATTAYVCTVTVLGREHLTVPSGSYDAIKLDVQLAKVGKDRQLEPHKKFKRATVWLSNDSDRLVLRIEAQIFLGTVFAELQSAQFEHGKP